MHLLSCFKVDVFFSKFYFLWYSSCFAFSQLLSPLVSKLICVCFHFVYSRNILSVFILSCCSSIVLCFFSISLPLFQRWYCVYFLIFIHVLFSQYSSFSASSQLLSSLVFSFHSWVCACLTFAFLSLCILFKIRGSSLHNYSPLRRPLQLVQKFFSLLIKFCHFYFIPWWFFFFFFIIFCCTHSRWLSHIVISFILSRVATILFPPLLCFFGPEFCLDFYYWFSVSDKLAGNFFNLYFICSFFIFVFFICICIFICIFICVFIFNLYFVFTFITGFLYQTN